MKKAMLALSALTFILAGCDTAENAATQQAEPVADTLPSKVSDSVATVTDSVSSAANAVTESIEDGDAANWQGTYQGTLPCADCAGIDYTLTLNEDQSYSLVQAYQGKEGAEPTTSEGKFHWNDTGSVITLEDGSETPNQYFVGDDMLMKLDINGEKVTGDMAALYNLQKQ